MREAVNILKESRHISEIYGVLIALALILYFFIMKIAGLAEITELRLFNFPIFLTGIYFAFRQYRKTHNGRLDYFHAMLTGMATTFICTTIFALFVFAYLQLNAAFLRAVVEHSPLGQYMNVYTASFAIWFEGLFAGYMCSFGLANWQHTDKVEVS